MNEVEMKSVMISIQPKWCELIASGKKTIEVRKSRPKIDVPFQCYIYCTASNIHECLMQNENGTKLIHAINYKTAIPVGGYVGNGKVIGEFRCDEIINAIDIDGNEFYTKSCMSLEEWLKYTDNHKGEMWCWHISNLVIYDKPKELSEFVVERYPCLTRLKRPPQSWCYIDHIAEKDGAE